MAARALILDYGAILRFRNTYIDEAWFDTFEGCPEGVKRIEVSGCVYMLSAAAGENSHLLVTKIKENGLCTGASRRREAFERACHVALSVFERSVVIPTQWRPYHRGAHISIFASAWKPSYDRVYFHVHPKDMQNVVYAYALTSEPTEFDDVREDVQLCQEAYDNYIDALIEAERAPSGPEAPDNVVGRHDVVLSPLPDDNATQGLSLTDWLTSRLTSEQMTFVEKDYSMPVRLRGAAGTGKTLSMVIKFLRDAYRFEDEHEPKRMLFLTHSEATQRQVQESLLQLDHRRLWDRWRYVRPSLRTLYSLAHERLHYDLYNLEPLHTDGVEGRKMQMELIGPVLDAARRNTWFKLTLRKCSPEFAETFLTDEPRRRERFIRELMNEFANVLDADKVQLGTQAAESYLRGRREAWQMPLCSEEDRQIVLRLHDRYCEELKSLGVLSLDQMIADLTLHLASNVWDRIRPSEGFDAIYVDEFHLFTRPERMSLHSLIRDRVNQPLPLFMAYDLRQSPDDSFYEGSGEPGITFYKSIGSGQLVKLTRAFRFTPEIAEFLTQLDSSFPAADLPAEWDDYEASSEREHGEIPELWSFPTNTKLMKTVFDSAWAEARQKGGRRVAVLCVSDEMFDVYTKAGHLIDKRLQITSKEQAHDMKYAGKRFILSQPRYVAGLQFDTVYLINPDKAELVEGSSIGEKSRFVRAVYLGAGRAESRLIIATSEERGGEAAVFNVPLQSNALKRRAMV